MKNIVLFILLVAVLLTGCTNPEEARTVLIQNGYTDIEIVGYDAFRCSEGDYFRTEFNATNSASIRVNGVVCSGFLKGATIRF